MPTKPPTHGAQLRRRQDAARGSAAQRGYDYRWQKYSEQYRIENPLCVRCKAKNPPLYTPSEVVDHIEPHNGRQDPKFMDPKNHQALCKECHDTKTATEDGGFGK